MKTTFREQLAKQLSQMGFGEIEMDSFDDKSCSWVEFKLDGKILNFTFNHAGTKLVGVEMFEEIIEVVDQKKIFGRMEVPETPKAEGSTDAYNKSKGIVSISSYSFMTAC